MVLLAVHLFIKADNCFIMFLVVSSASTASLAAQHTLSSQCHSKRLTTPLLYRMECVGSGYFHGSSCPLLPWLCPQVLCLRLHLHSFLQTGSLQRVQAASLSCLLQGSAFLRGALGTKPLLRALRRYILRGVHHECPVHSACSNSVKVHYYHLCFISV